jgi:hypothetical protein
MDGISTRLLELNACPLMNEDGTVNTELGIRLHTEAKHHYGFAGGRFIHFLIHDVIGAKNGGDVHSGLDADYQMMIDRLSVVTTEEARTNPHFASVAVIALADFYSSVCVFGMDREKAVKEAVGMASLVMERIEQDKPVDSIQSAWNYVVNWIASNSAHFVKPDSGVTSLYPPREASPIYGAMEKNKVYVIASDLNQALSDGGYSYRKCIRGFQRSGFLETFVDSEGKNRSQTAKVIHSVQTRVYALNLKTNDEDARIPMDDTVPAFSDSVVHLA